MGIEERCRVWRQAAARLPGRRQGRRYPPRMRAAAVALVEEAISEGAGTASACRWLGVPPVTLAAWRRRQALVPVRVVAAPAAPLRLQLGDAYVDLTVEQLVGVLRAAR
jgi:hypothetical protein